MGRSIYSIWKPWFFPDFWDPEVVESSLYQKSICIPLLHFHVQGLSTQIAQKQRPILQRNIGWKFYQKVSSPSLDVDIYENVRQISLSPLFSEVWSFSLRNTLKILTYTYNEKSWIYWRKMIISLRPFDIKKFALHFQKYPHLGKSLMHFVDISNQHLMVI